MHKLELLPPIQIRPFQHAREFPLIPSWSIPTKPQTPKATTLQNFHHRLFLSVLEFHINGIIQYTLFYIWLFLFPVSFLNFIHVVVPVSCSFSLLSSIPLGEHTMVCTSILLLEMASNSGLLRAKPLWSFSYMSFCAYVFVSFAKWLEVQFLVHRTCTCLTSHKGFDLMAKVIVLFSIPAIMH